MVGQCHSCQLFQQYGNIKAQTCNNIVCRIWDFTLKTNSGLQQLIYQEQSILRQICNLERQRMPLSGNSILLFFIKLLKHLERKTYISLLLELISNWIDTCLGIQKPEAMAISALSLTWNNNDFYMLHLSVLQVEY